MDSVSATLEAPHTSALKPNTQTYKLKSLYSKKEMFYVAVMNLMLLMLAINTRPPGTRPVELYMSDQYPIMMKVFMMLAFYLPYSIFFALDVYFFAMVIMSMRAKAMQECPGAIIHITDMLKPCYSSFYEVIFFLFLDGVLLMLWEWMMHMWNDIRVMLDIDAVLYAILLAASRLPAVDKSFGWECRFMGYKLFDIEKPLRVILVPVELFLSHLPALILVALNVYYFAMVLRVVWTNIKER